MPSRGPLLAVVRGDVAAFAIVFVILIALVGVAPRAFHVAARQPASGTTTQGRVVRVEIGRAHV